MVVGVGVERNRREHCSALVSQAVLTRPVERAGKDRFSATYLAIILLVVSATRLKRTSLRTSGRCAILETIPSTILSEVAIGS